MVIHMQMQKAWANQNMPSMQCKVKRHSYSALPTYTNDSAAPNILDHLPQTHKRCMNCLNTNAKMPRQRIKIDVFLLVDYTRCFMPCCADIKANGT